MEKSAYDKGYEQGYAEAMEVVKKTKIIPTKEQIDIVAKELFDKDFLPKPVHMNKWKTAPDYVKYRYKFYAQLAIETWEKIRNQQ